MLGKTGTGKSIILSDLRRTGEPVYLQAEGTTAAILWLTIRCGNNNRL